MSALLIGRHYPEMKVNLVNFGRDATNEERKGKDEAAMEPI